MEGQGMSTKTRTSGSEVKGTQSIGSNKFWQPVVTLRRLELQGLESVRIQPCDDPRRPQESGSLSVSRKGLKRIQGPKRSSSSSSFGVRSSGKMKTKSKLQSVWLLPDGSISFRKPQKYSLRPQQPSLMLKQKIVTTRSSLGAAEGFAMPLWKPYSNEKKKMSSKRKTIAPVKLDSILTQVTSNQLLNDDQLVQHLKVRKPEAMPKGKVTWTGVIKMMPKTNGANRKKLMKPSWKNPKIFFKGTVFEPIFHVPDLPDADGSHSRQQGASFPGSSKGLSFPESNGQGSPESNGQGSPKSNGQGSPESNGQGSPESNGQSSPASSISSTSVRNLSRTFRSHEDFRSRKAGELRKTISNDMRKAAPQWVTKSKYKFLKNCSILGSRTRISDGQCFYIAGSEYEPEAGTVMNEFFHDIDPDFGPFGAHHLDPDKIGTKPRTSGDIVLKKNRSSKTASPSPDSSSSVENHCPGEGSFQVIDLF